jgi:hypothetical protein
MTHQTSLFDFERETPQDIITRIQQRAQDSITDQEGVLYA